jgi:hypothetical protein
MMTFLSVQAFTTAEKPFFGDGLHLITTPTAQNFMIRVECETCEGGTDSVAAVTTPMRWAVVAAAIIATNLYDTRLGTAAVLFVSIGVVTAQLSKPTVFVEIDVPTGFCFPTIYFDPDHIDCPDCEQWRCPANAEKTSVAISTSDPFLLPIFQALDNESCIEGNLWLPGTRTCESKVHTNLSCPLGGRVVPTYTRNLTVAQLQANSDEVGCWPCPDGTFMLQIGDGCQECVYPSRCLEHNRCDWDFVGPGCPVCPEGYHQKGREEDAKCHPCPTSSWLGYIILAFAFAGTLAGFMKLALSRNMAEASTNTKENVAEVYDFAKKILSYLQALTIIVGFKAFNYPAGLKAVGHYIKSLAFLDVFEGVANIFAAFEDIAIPTDCLFASNDEDQQEKTQADVDRGLTNQYWNRFVVRQRSSFCTTSRLKSTISFCVLVVKKPSVPCRRLKLHFGC